MKIEQDQNRKSGGQKGQNNPSRTYKNGRNKMWKNGNKTSKGAHPIFEPFFQTSADFWYHKKLIFFITHVKFHSSKVFHFLDIKKRVW